jgi:hypothetical protein
VGRLAPPDEAAVKDRTGEVWCDDRYNSDGGDAIDEEDRLTTPDVQAGQVWKYTLSKSTVDLYLIIGVNPDASVSMIDLARLNLFENIHSISWPRTREQLTGWERIT